MVFVEESNPWANTVMVVDDLGRPLVLRSFDSETYEAEVYVLVNNGQIAAFDNMKIYLKCKLPGAKFVSIGLEPICKNCLHPHKTHVGFPNQLTTSCCGLPNCECKFYDELPTELKNWKSNT